MNFLLRPVGSESTDPVITINPIPGFTIKSRLASCVSNTLTVDTKIFINVCHNEQVPRPEVDFNPSIVYPLIMTNQWEIPIITSSVREDVDKKGVLCYVWDCCINTTCMGWITKDLQLREILIEWCIESCELRQSVEICRDHLSFPKLKKKGDKIPPLDILTNDLTHNYREEVDSIVQEGTKDPTSILAMKRDLLSAEESMISDSGTLPPLFPRDQKTNKRPIIEEIENLTISSDPNTVQANEALKKAQQKELTFDVVMGKISNNVDYILKVEVTSELSCLDEYDVQYNKMNNELLIQNRNLTNYKEKKLAIALPNVFKTQEPRLKISFINMDRKLIVYL